MCNNVNLAKISHLVFKQTTVFECDLNVKTLLYNGNIASFSIMASLDALFSMTIDDNYILCTALHRGVMGMCKNVN